MAFFSCHKVVISLAILVLVFTGSSSAKLSKDFYKTSCPKLLRIVREGVQAELGNDLRMGASLLRLHFHDCFVNGCDGSVLLNDTPNFVGEKTAPPNMNSLRGFEAIDRIKHNVEKECPRVVSCADILALAARESVVYLRGPSWNDLEFGRRDATRANKTDAANDLPSPTSNISDLIKSFSKFNFSSQELVALSGAHTIGKARCTNFRDRIYKEDNIDATFRSIAKTNCSKLSQDDNNLALLDYTSSTTFDKNYFRNLVFDKGLLHSDQQLYVRGNKQTSQFVIQYKNKQDLFFADFANAMMKMSRLRPLMTPNGEIRSHCWKTNS